MTDTTNASKQSSFFSWFTRARSDKKPMGVELGSKEGVKAQMQKFQGNVVRTSRIVQNNLEKYSEIKKLNEELTKSYVQNLVVFRDVNEMLQTCLNVFKSLEAEFTKLEEVTGRELNTSDFDYLNNLTRSKIDSLSYELNKQAEMLKNVYTMYGRPEELNRIILAQSNMKKVVEDATITYNKIAGPSKKKKEQKKESNKLTNANVFNDTTMVSNVVNVDNVATDRVPSVNEVTPTDVQSGGIKKRPKNARKEKQSKNTVKSTKKVGKMTKSSKK